MKHYQFNKIKKIFVTGDCRCELKTALRHLKENLILKDDDALKPHPMEAERQARKRAKEAAEMEMQRNERRGYGIRPGRNGHPAYFDAGALHTINDNGMTFSTISIDDSALKTYTRSIKESLKSKFSDSIIFIAGDCGLGFNSEKAYLCLFEKMNKILEYNNTYVILVRGNNDNPEYFNGEKINFSNIKAVPDYSIISTSNKNVLCIGGAVSADRAWRKEQEKRIERFSKDRKLYFENEAPVLDKEKMDEIFKEIAKIDIVISHSAPSFATPSMHVGVKEWEELDKELKDDINNERLTMDRIFEYLRDNNRKPSYWAYSHFNISYLEKRSDVVFRSIDGSDFSYYCFDEDMFSIEHGGEAISLKKGKKLKASSSAFNTINAIQYAAPHPEPENIPNNPFDGNAVEEAEDLGAEFDGDAFAEEPVNERVDEGIFELPAAEPVYARPNADITAMINQINAATANIYATTDAIEAVRVNNQ